MNFSRISAKVDDPKVGQGEIFFFSERYDRYAKKIKFDAANFHFEKVAKYQEMILHDTKCTYSAINSNGFTSKNFLSKKGEAFLL